MTERAAAAVEETFPPGRYAWSVVGVLCIAATCAFIDRQLIYLFVDPMRATLGLTDTQLSVIQGLAFVVFYVVMGVPLGRLVDRYNRRNLIILGIVTWSVMTILCGFAHDFWSLFAARAGVGVGEAVLGPAAYSLLADYFAPAKRGRAIAMVGICGALGAGASFLLGGAVLQAIPGEATVAFGPFGERLGWQVAFIIAGLPGFAVALLMFAVREPERQETRYVGVKPGERPRVAPYFARHWVPLAGVIVATGLLGLAAYAFAGWIPTYFMRRLGVEPATAGYAVGVLILIAALGGIAGGALSDHLAQRRLGGRLDILLISSLLAAPLLAAWTIPDDPLVAWVLALLALTAINLGVSTVAAILQEIAPNQLRGLVLGSAYVFQGVLGPGLGPMSVALVTDRVFHDPGALDKSIPLVTAPVCLTVVLFALLVRGSYARSRRAIVDAA